MSTKTKKKTPEPSVRGLFLWKVKTSLHPDDISHLWITTPNHNIIVAARKALAFERRESGRQKVTIESIEQHGTLDA